MASLCVSVLTGLIFLLKKHQAVPMMCVCGSCLCIYVQGGTEMKRIFITVTRSCGFFYYGATNISCMPSMCQAIDTEHTVIGRY